MSIGLIQVMRGVKNSDSLLAAECLLQKDLRKVRAIIYSNVAVIGVYDNYLWFHIGKYYIFAIS